MNIFVILSLILTIASAQDPCGINTLCTAVPSQECINDICENVSPPFVPPPPSVAQIQPAIQTCSGFEGCEEYITGCEECEYDDILADYVCKQSGEDPCEVPAPDDICKKCRDGYEASPDVSTCCIAVEITSDAPDPQVIELLFTQMDTNSVGYVSLSEILARSALATTNPKKPEKIAEKAAKAAEIFSKADTNGDMLLSEEELLAADIDVDDFKIEAPSPDSPEEVEIEAVSPDSPDSPEEVTGDVGDAGAGGAMANDGNNTPDMFGIRNAKPAATYSILSVIIIAGLILLVVMSWGIYQYISKRKAVKQLNEMEQVAPNEYDENENENTVIITETC